MHHFLSSEKWECDLKNEILFSLTKMANITQFENTACRESGCPPIVQNVETGMTSNESSLILLIKILNSHTL